MLEKDNILSVKIQYSESKKQDYNNNTQGNKRIMDLDVLLDDSGRYSETWELGTPKGLSKLS